MSPTQRFTGGRVRDGVTAVSIADVLLATAAQSRAISLVVEPGNTGHDVTLETPAGSQTALVLDADLGDAVVARIALVAGLDVATRVEQLGRIRVGVGSTRADLVVLVSSAPRGLGLELRRLVRPRDLAGSGSSSVPPPLAGSPEVIGAYRLIRQIGEGGMGVVWLAEHMALAKQVALKILHERVASDPELAGSLLREGRLASRAQSEGIVNVTDFGQTPDGRTYLVMEFVEWPTLYDVMSGNPLPPRRALVIARQILLALDAAHAQGVVHRDLKPENIFVSADDHVKIGDFGTAKFQEAPGVGGRDLEELCVVGSPHYMSPEHASGAETDRRSDIYTTGCVLFEMLTGNVPYDAATPGQVLLMHRSAPVPVPAVAGESLDDTIVETVRRAMAKRPDDRYQTASEMIDDVDLCSRALGRAGWRRWLPS